MKIKTKKGEKAVKKVEEVEEQKPAEVSEEEVKEEVTANAEEVEEEVAGEEVEDEEYEEEEEEERDLLDILLDKENKENIVLYDGDGKRTEFEQIAIIPMDQEDGERRLYVILKPVDKIAGMSDDEAVVFYCAFDEEDGSTFLKVEESDEVADAVFEKYYELMKGDSEQ